MTRRVTVSQTTSVAKRLPVFNQRGYRMREGDFFKVTGKNSWWRFIAYVLPGEGREGYIECIELKDKAQTGPHVEKDGSTREKTGAMRCIDAGKIREVMSRDS